MAGSSSSRYLRRILHLVLAMATVMVVMEVPPSGAQTAQVRVSGSSSSSSQTGSAGQTRPPASSPPSGGAPTSVPRAPSVTPPPSGSPGGGHPGGGHWGGGYWGHRGPGWGWGWWGGLYWPYYHWGLWGWGPSYYPYRAGYQGPVYAYGAPALGGLKLKVKPKKAAVYLTGEYIGQAKRFDGYPGYLWLEQGSQELTFYMPGYRTQTQTIRVLPGVVARVEIRLEPGESVPPEEMPIGAPASPEPVAGASARPPGSGESLESLGISPPGSARLIIDPDDASVYLNGRFLGTGREIAGLHSGLVMEPGRHTLEVVRPGYVTEKLDFVVSEGSDVDVKVTLVRE